MNQLEDKNGKRERVDELCVELDGLIEEGRGRLAGGGVSRRYQGASSLAPLWVAG